MRVIRKVLVVFSLALAAAAMALVALGVAPAQAATRHSSKREVSQLNRFLSAFAEEHLTSFTRSAGPSNLLLVRFGVWHTFHKNFSAVVTDDSGYGYLDSAIVDTVDQRYFGRTATARESYPSADIAYIDGSYRFMPGMGDPGASSDADAGHLLGRTDLERVSARPESPGMVAEEREGGPRRVAAGPRSRTWALHRSPTTSCSRGRGSETSGTSLSDRSQRHGRGRGDAARVPALGRRPPQGRG